MGNTRDERAEHLSDVIAEIVEDAGPNGVVFSEILHLAREEWGDISERQCHRHLKALDYEGRVHRVRQGEDDDRTDNRRTTLVYRRGPSQENLAQTGRLREKVHVGGDKARYAASQTTASAIYHWTMNAKEYFEAILPELKTAKEKADRHGTDVPVSKRGRVH